MPLPRDLPGRPDERVLRQLVAALLFENLLDASSTLDGDAHLFAWQLGCQSYRCRADIGAFGRIRAHAGSVEVYRDGQWEPADLRALVENLPGDPEARTRLLGELEQTVAFCRWNEANIPPASRRTMAFAELEAALDEGHPYHPCFKSRTGFDIPDHAAYGPETRGLFQLVWLAMDRRDLAQVLPTDETEFWIRELGPDTFQDLSERRAALGLHAREYGFLPLHPWQWRALKDGALAPLLDDGRAHCLGPAGDRYRATQSLRSLTNADRAGQAGIKLAMDLVNTSARRTLEPHSVTTAPVLSDWLAGIVASDPDFRTRYPLAILGEYAGIVAAHGGALEGQLGAIFRQNVDVHLEWGEAAVPLNALMAVERDGRPFIHDWIARHGLQPWIERLIEVAILPVWHLLVAHGIATESHGQNMVLVHRDGWPVRLILRDFHDSVEYVRAYLRDPAKEPDFETLNPVYREARADQYYWMSSVEELRALVVDCLFVYNFAEISHLLSECYGLPERAFWERVDRRLQRYAREHSLERRQAALGHTGDTAITESLLARKLRPGQSHHSHPIPNMFGAPAPDAAADIYDQDRRHPLCA